MIYAGFDCGGSNTRCMIVSQQGDILGSGKGGSANFRFCGKEAAAESLTNSIRLAFEDARLEPQPIACMFIASAPVEVFGDPADEAFYREVTGCKKIITSGDIYPVWYAGSRLAPAIAMIAGTGTCVYLLRDRSYAKSSGWGPCFGDEGSGYDIGVHALRYTARMADGRMEMDEAFYLAVLNHFGATAEAPHVLVDLVAGSEYVKRIASVSYVVMELCDSGNPTAQALVDYGADELILAVSSLLRRAPDYEFDLLLSGGLLENDTPLRRAFLSRAHTLKRIHSIKAPNIPSVQAAASLALLHSGHQEAAERLMQHIWSL